MITKLNLALILAGLLTAMTSVIAYAAPPLPSSFYGAVPQWCPYC